MPLDEFADFACPYCGQTNPLSVDLSAGSHQEFVVDCEVCCSPIMVRLKVRSGAVVWMDVRRENE